MSRISEIANKYKLDAKEDFWKHKQSGQWIITHDACEKIAQIEGITFERPDVYRDNNSNVAMVGGATLGDRYEWSTGEASPTNCKMSYNWAMAEKRLKDRLTLKLINAYQWGVSSEIEAESFKKPVDKFDPYTKHSGVEHEVLLSKAQGKKIIVLESELTGQVKPVDFTNLTSADAEDYIVKLEGMKNELSEV